jgi:hypothetical protein
MHSTVSASHIHCYFIIPVIHGEEYKLLIAYVCIYPQKYTAETELLTRARIAKTVASADQSQKDRCPTGADGSGHSLQGGV